MSLGLLRSGFVTSRVPIASQSYAVLDRYRTIRNFFKVQQAHLSSVPPVTETVRINFRRSFGSHHDVRKFHSTALLSRERGKPGFDENLAKAKSLLKQHDRKQSSGDPSRPNSKHVPNSSNTTSATEGSPSIVESLIPHDLSATQARQHDSVSHLTPSHDPSAPRSESEAAGTFSVSNQSLRSKSDTSIHSLEDSAPRPSSELPKKPPSETATSDSNFIPPPHNPGIHPPDDKPPSLPYNFENYSRFFRRLALSAPHLNRPTRDDFLRVADGFWQRLRIRFKWFTIKSFRKFNADDISGIVTWILMSQTIWILIGTTTFFSVIFAIANSLRLQHFVARGISDYLTSETGITIIFESAIVPKWKDSRISFKNVYVSRRPSSMSARPKKIDVHMAAAGYDVSNHPAYHRVDEDEDEEPVPNPEEDTNYSMFDLNIDSVDVTLSLWRWLDGKGLVEDAVVKGVRGVLDRRSVYYDPEHPLDPASFRHESYPGDFELESLQLEDVLITVQQPGGFRPYTASIFRADIRCFRRRWMFYDFLSAENIVGQFDNCLFSLHKPQSIGRTNEMDLQDGEWARMSRIRIDGVNIDHLQHSTSMEGPVSWITSGKLDAVLDIKFPRDPDDALALNAILEEIADAISTTLSTSPDPAHPRIPGQRQLAKPALSAPEIQNADAEDNDQPKVVIDIDLRFRDVKAAVPLFTNDLSYVNNALIRPIVAFMNANRTLVPIHCRVVKNLSDFDGSWTMWEAGLLDEIAVKIYDALAFHVTQANMNRRIKTVSVWSLQMTASAVLSALRNLMDPVSLRVKEAYLRSRERGDMFDFGAQVYGV